MATFRASANGGGTSGTSNRTVTFTPAVGDLIIVFCAVTTNTNTTPTTTDSAASGTYTLADTAVYTSTLGDSRVLSAFVRNAFSTGTGALTITCNTGSNTSGALTAIGITGMPWAGAGALRQIGSNSSGSTAASVTASWDTALAALTANMCLNAVSNSNVPGGVTTPPTSWTNRSDTGQSTPAVGIDTATRDSGETGSTITWGQASASKYAAIILELNTVQETEVRSEGAISVVKRRGWY